MTEAKKLYKFCEACEYFMDEKCCWHPGGCGCCACSGIAHEYDMFNEYEGCSIEFVVDKEKPERNYDKKEKNDSKE